MQLLTYETVFEYIVWPIRRTVRRVHRKKWHNFTQRFDLQGHAGVQIFTYKGESVCNVSSRNFHMFYDKRRVSTQISRLCHVHAQVHTLKDMSSHTFCLMEMCPSTVWHLVPHYFVWCEGTLNVMFTLKTLLGCVYVQLLTYKAAFLKNSLSWPTCLHASSSTKRGGTNQNTEFCHAIYFAP